MDSGLILDYAERLAAPRASLLPKDGRAAQHDLRLTGLALAGCEKAVQIVYETTLRPVEKQHAAWLERVRGQLGAALATPRGPTLVRHAAGGRSRHDHCRPGSHDRRGLGFTQSMMSEVVAASTHPALVAHAAAAEALPEFRACRRAEAAATEIHSGTRDAGPPTMNSPRSTLGWTVAAAATESHRIMSLPPATPAACSGPRRQRSTARFSWSAAARPAPPSPRCSPRRGRDVILAEKDAIRAFISASRCCPPTPPCSTASACARRSKRIGMTKYGAEFVSPDHDHQAMIDFAEAWDKSMPYAWQVRRSELDELLFRNAARKRRARPRGLPRAQGRVRRRGRHGRRPSSTAARNAAWRTRFLVDATGRDTLLANQFRCKQKNPQAQQLGALRPLPRRPAPRGPARGQHHDLLVRPRLVLADPAGRRRHQHRRGLLAVLPEVARQAAARVLRRHDRALPGAGRAARRRQSSSSEVHATGNYSYSSRIVERRALPAARRRLRLHRPGVLLRASTWRCRAPSPAPRSCEATLDRPRQAAAARRRFDRQMRRGPRAVLVVHLPRLEPDDARVLHGAGRTRSA